ncbi:transcriptional regulator with XRE-family HTH domain [Kitasatospora sp. MAA4]|uniref:helix-turn-helix transcriptional regulator n=1 Tax=Kitasatospora sp. MAA4 TaxID=3035093 RepID=UPI0024750AFC|nr:helix-turn-helix transcriptional regulator [Kitasatospora sp. MAA4]MDH6130676.1 transcriptional regulator with XRE-family HTH domain [Kitasatospora sp. MAA4]
MGETFPQALRRLRGTLSIRDLARLANCAKTAVSDLETGRRQPTATIAATLDRALGAGGLLIDLAANPPGTPAADRAAALQTGFAQQLAAGPMTEASLDEWEFTIARHGRATRYRPENELLPDLLADFADLRSLLGHRQSAPIRRRLLSACASLAGLLALTLLKLDDPGARDWWRTGRAAATQAEDRPTLAWIYAQESYQLYYGGDFAGALELADRAQRLAGGLPCVADALAAPLEARVHARAGRRDAAADALERAETALGRLSSADQQASAMGYDAAQLAFHSGSAWTHLHDTGRAWEQQQRALELYPVENRLDRALVALDRAECLAWDGRLAEGAHLTAETVAALPLEHRSALVLYRARDLVDTVPETERRLPEVRVLHDLLALPSTG